MNRPRPVAVGDVSRSSTSSTGRGSSSRLQPGSRTSTGGSTGSELSSCTYDLHAPRPTGRNDDLELGPGVQHPVAHQLRQDHPGVLYQLVAATPLRCQLGHLGPSLAHAAQFGRQSDHEGLGDVAFGGDRRRDCAHPSLGPRRVEAERRPPSRDRSQRRRRGPAGVPSRRRCGHVCGWRRPGAPGFAHRAFTVASPG